MCALVLVEAFKTKNTFDQTKLTTFFWSRTGSFKKVIAAWIIPQQPQPGSSRGEDHSKAASQTVWTLRGGEGDLKSRNSSRPDGSRDGKNVEGQPLPVARSPGFHGHGALLGDLQDGGAAAEQHLLPQRRSNRRKHQGQAAKPRIWCQGNEIDSAEPTRWGDIEELPGIAEKVNLRRWQLKHR